MIRNQKAGMSDGKRRPAASMRPRVEPRCSQVPTAFVRGNEDASL